MSRRHFYITTPIYYVNDKPHIGHAYTTVLADVLARYQRLFGSDVFFLTGTDEHGQKVERAAKDAQLTPQGQVDATVVRFQELWQRLGISNDDFIRTTEERHKRVVQKILQDLYERGEIYRAEYDGWYCTPCERFFTEKDLVDAKCPDCGRSVEKIKEANYFFRMSKYQDWLVKYIEEHPEFIQPDFRRNETLGFLQKKLNDLCISRPKSRLSWGIEIPFDNDYVTYVWFDALVNYISAVGYLFDDEKFNDWWPADYHLIGKDILTTHTVYWPTMLQAMGLAQPRTIFAHGWWLSGAHKMSKSLGNVVNPMSLAEKYGVDAFRYFLMAEMVLGQDASFSEEGFARRFNADLANDLGNLVSRLLRMLENFCGGVLPSVPTEDDCESQALWAVAQEAVGTMVTAVQSMKLDAGLAKVINLVRAANRYLEVKQPWRLAKQGSLGAASATLLNVVDVVRVAAGLLHPIMPSKMTVIYEAFGLEGGDFAVEFLNKRWHLRPGETLGKPGILFPRIEIGGGSAS